MLHRANDFKNYVCFPIYLFISQSFFKCFSIIAFGGAQRPFQIAPVRGLQKLQAARVLSEICDITHFIIKSIPVTAFDKVLIHILSWVTTNMTDGNLTFDCSLKGFCGLHDAWHA